MNKKLFLGMLILGIMVVGVSAIIYYNATIDVKANISEPLVTSIIPLSFSGYATDMMSQEITITNNAQGNVPATFSWNPNEGVVVDTMNVNGRDLIGINQTIDIPHGEHKVNISFSTSSVMNGGTLRLTQKNLTTWKHIDGGITKDIAYSLSGDTFVVTGIPMDYTLIYYPEIGDFEANVAGIIVLQEGSNDISSLPIGVDENDDYCEIEGTEGLANPDSEMYDGGAKLWLIPGEKTQALEKVSSWSNPETYLFETDLITYTKEESDSIGNITVQRLPA